MLLSIRQIQSRILGRLMHKLPALKPVYIDRVNNVDRYRIYKPRGDFMVLLISDSGVCLETQMYGRNCKLARLHAVAIALRHAACGA